MRRPRRNRHLVFALYANAALLAAVLLTLLSRSSSSPSLTSQAFGRDPQPIAGGGGLFLMPAQFSSTTWGCYIMDIDAQTICAYEYIPRNAKNHLRLVAARHFRYDRYLKRFNTADPTPEEVQQLVELERRGPRGLRDPAPPEGEEPGEDDAVREGPDAEEDGDEGGAGDEPDGRTEGFEPADDGWETEDSADETEDSDALDDARE